MAQWVELRVCAPVTQNPRDDRKCAQSVNVLFRQILSKQAPSSSYSGLVHLSSHCSTLACHMTECSGFTTLEARQR